VSESAELPWWRRVLRWCGGVLRWCWGVVRKIFLANGNGTRVLRVTQFVLACSTALLIVMQIQVSRLNNQLDKVETSTTDIQSFVAELRRERAAPPDPQLQTVFQAVFDMFTLMCNESDHVNDPICQQG
jgi:hypothetical protein